MPKYILLLGQAADLAKIELWSVFNSSSKETIFGPNFAIIDAYLDPMFIMKKLGGTVKVAEYLEEINDLSSVDEKWWLEKITNNKKINFGFSLYNDQAKNYQKIKKVALAVKKNLSKSGQPARLVISRGLELSSVIVTKNKLINNELIFIKNKNNYVVGRTIAVQDFADYAQRDILRPQRDDRSGMLPPKLAKMMINISGAKKTDALLDPFCGSGTVLQEAALLGINKISGTDLSQKACQDTEKNLAWLKNQYNLGFYAQIKKADARSLSQYLAKQSINVIVTEPYMGPAKEIIKNTKRDYFLNLSQELSQLYISTFKEFKKILKPGARVIFIFPIFNLMDQKIYTLDAKNISALGYRLQKPPIQLSTVSKNGQIIYQRPQQKVAREISIWEVL